MRITVPLLTLCTALPACSLIVDPDVGRLGPRPGMDAAAGDGGRTDRDGGDAPDARTADDASVPTDAGTDAGPPPVGPGCADGTEEQGYDVPTMVGCDGLATQCAAGTLCASGWHLCTYGEYAARGGADEPSALSRWVAGCIRRTCSLDPMPPEDGICGDCTSGEAMLPIPVAFSCGGFPQEAISCDIGATAAFGRNRLGSMREPCLYAEPAVTRTRLGAMCCR